MSTKKTKIKCYDCSDVFYNLEDLYLHIEEEHADMIPSGFSVQRYYYMRRTGKTCGNCVICKKPTTWNENTNKYNRFCNNPRCKNVYREEFKKRMIGKHGKIHLLNDPSVQRKMLANRSISGIYKWSDGKNKSYTGSYEKKALEYEDVVLNMSSDDVMTPSPHNYFYEYEGSKHFYIPDQYIVSLNAEIEIKDGGDNPNKHPKIQSVDKVKEKLKDDVMKSQKAVNYLKLTNNNMSLLLKFIDTIKQISLSDNPNKRVIMIEDEIIIKDSTTRIVAESYDPEYELSEADKILVEHLRRRIMREPDNMDIVSKVDKDLLEDMIKEGL